MRRIRADMRRRARVNPGQKTVLQQNSENRCGSMAISTGRGAAWLCPSLDYIFLKTHAAYDTFQLAPQVFSTFQSAGFLAQHKYLKPPKRNK